MGHELRPEDITYLRSIPDAVRDAGMHGLDHVVNVLVVALISGGHVLLEGNPGLGKTALVKALSQALGLGREAVGRIQFTPDLMPADITGSLMPRDDNSMQLEFREGPIFHELLLADEINRATPKTQAAMLEAMAEFQVTVLGERKPLRKAESVGNGRTALTPFMVMATQNPIDQDGTFDLPEAQLDRFMFKVRMRMPGADTIARIVDKELSAQPAGAGGQEDVADRQKALRALEQAGAGTMAHVLPPSVRAHILNIVMASNGEMDQVQAVSRTRLKALEDLTSRVEYPFGPRAAITLAKAVLGWSACVLTERDRPSELGAAARTALAQVLVPCLRHRIRIRHTYDNGFGGAGAEADAVDAFVRDLALAAAPDGRIESDTGDYHKRFEGDLKAAVGLHL